MMPSQEFNRSLKITRVASPLVMIASAATCVYAYWFGHYGVAAVDLGIAGINAYLIYRQWGKLRFLK